MNIATELERHTHKCTAAALELLKTLQPDAASVFDALGELLAHGMDYQGACDDGDAEAFLDEAGELYRLYEEQAKELRSPDPYGWKQDAAEDQADNERQVRVDG